MAAVASLTLSDRSLANFHPDFDRAVLKDSSKRAACADGAPETWRKVRMVVYDTVSRTIAVLYKSETDEHELPGGGRKSSGKRLEGGLRAVRRELREEIGLEWKSVIVRIGECLESRAKLNLKIESSCYLVLTDGSRLGKPKLSKREEAAGLSVLWLPANQAMGRIAGQEHESYTSVFEQYRNLWLLGIALERIAAENIA